MDSLIKTIRNNCIISDTRDNGIYSMCMLFLRLRNYYKWESGLEPWQEAEPPVLLDWIADREELWDTLLDEDYNEIECGYHSANPMDVDTVNRYLSGSGLIYGAGLGKSLKAVFFLAHQLSEIEEAGCPAKILGKEEARELDSPFAMIQEKTIYFRTEPFRYFLWDRIMEPAPSSRVAMLQAMKFYGCLLPCGSIDQDALKEKLAEIVLAEMLPIIHHEVGEMKEDYFSRSVLQMLVAAFPGSAVELLVRAVKDILADVHPQGQLGWIIANEKESSLALYSTYLEGLRKSLFPDLAGAVKLFFENGDWDAIEKVRVGCLAENRIRAEKIEKIASQLGKIPETEVEKRINQEILAPLTGEG